MYRHAQVEGPVHGCVSSSDGPTLCFGPAQGTTSLASDDLEEEEALHLEARSHAIHNDDHIRRPVRKDSYECFRKKLWENGYGKSGVLVSSFPTKDEQW